MKGLRAAMMTGVLLATIALLALSAAPGYAATVYDTAKSYYKMDDNDPGSVTVLDSTLNVNKNNGTAPTYTHNMHADGKIGGALTFNGSQKIIVPQSSNLVTGTGDFTISVWANTANNTNFAAFGLQWHTTNASNNIYIFAGLGATLWAYADNTPSGYLLVPAVSNAITTGTWQLFSFTRSGNDFAMYIDDHLASSYTQAYNFGSPLNDYAIGGYWGSVPQYFTGKLDELAIWNSALGVDDVKTLYYSGQVADAVSGLNLSYTPDEIENLAELFINTTGSVTTPDNYAWSYVYTSGTLPGAPPGAKPGDSWTASNGDRYMLLEVGSMGGLKGLNNNNGVPEPATVVGMVGVIIVIGYRRIRRK